MPPASLSSLPKKDDNELVASSMYTERPDLSWNLDLAPAKKYGGVEPAEESEMREGTGLMREEASPLLNWRPITGPMGHRLSLISELSIRPISR